MPTAAAQPSRWTALGRLELGSMLTHDQRTVLGIDGVAMGASVGTSFAIMESVRVDGVITGNYFLAGASQNAGVASASLGPRLVLPLSRNRLALEIAGHVGAAWTGPLLLPCLDASVGLAFRVTDEVSIGPELTFTQIVWPDTQGRTTDAQYLLGGVVIAFRPTRREESASEPATERTHTERIIERPTERVETVLLNSPPLIAPSEEELERLLSSAVPTGTRSEVYLVPPVLFAIDSALLSTEGEVAMHAALDLLVEFEGNVIIEGHSDESGALAHNRSLSEERARTVYFWLIERGIDASRLSMEAHGEDTPLEGNANDHVRTLNRRVTFRWVREGAQQR